MKEKLARYERILHEHGLLPQDENTSPSVEDTSPESISLHWNESTNSRTGRFISGQGKSRYIDNTLWPNLEEDEMQRVFDDERDYQEAALSDPLTGALLGSQHDLLQYHPTSEKAMMLWETHIRNVEPICKILHIPSTSMMIETALEQPERISKADECLLFAIYHFAIFSMSEDETSASQGQSRDMLLRRYHWAARQALVNASFLKTTEMTILQALVLFLLPCRYSYDPHTYWILTGVATRIAQRMGLHRDGEKLGLPPFETQMRRRLFYQLLPLDGMASQMSGTGMAVMPKTWDTQLPLNISDNHIWPGMIENPGEQKSATGMIFCLARANIGKFYIKAGKSVHGGDLGHFRDYNEAYRLIDEAERDIEEEFIRYCDIVKPIHFLTIASARAGIAAMRLRIGIQKVRSRTVTQAERKELFQLSQKIMDTDAAAHSQTSLKIFQWHIGPFFLMGTWESLAFILTSLCRTGLLSSMETDAAWACVEQVYTNHAEFMKLRRAMQIAFGRLTLKAWDINPPSTELPLPRYIANLRSCQTAKPDSQGQRQEGSEVTVDLNIDTLSSPRPSSVVDESNLFSMDFSLETDFNVDEVDWLLWDRLIHD
jgi:hypothetical protein